MLAKKDQKWLLLPGVLLLAIGVVAVIGSGDKDATTTQDAAITAQSSTSAEPEELAFAEKESTTSKKKVATSVVGSTVGGTASAKTTATAGQQQGSKTTSGSGGAPVVTRSGGGGADTSIYKGFLGIIGRNEVIAGAIATPPSVGSNILPLTGLAGQVPNRPAAIVKIDNSRPARPQTGLNAADIVVEEEVEGGVTRLAAVYHSTSSIVGPVRSGRTTDIGIINGFGSPLLMYSGANAVTDTLLRQQPTVQNRNAGTSSGYWRDRSRRAPSNLFTDTAPHWASASGGPPPPQFYYRGAGEASQGVADDSLTVSYRANRVGWQWDGSAYKRTQGGSSHMTAGEQVAAANVVVIEAREMATGMVDSSGATVPEFIFVGSGKATVFSDGKRVEGIWTRPTLAHVATITTADAKPIKVTPGRTWIELIRADAGMLS